jgi:hypothetical protein
MTHNAGLYGTGKLFIMDEDDFGLDTASEKKTDPDSAPYKFCTNFMQ